MTPRRLSTEIMYCVIDGNGKILRETNDLPYAAREARRQAKLGNAAYVTMEAWNGSKKQIVAYVNRHTGISHIPIAW